ncbi:MAG: iron-containing alcohol dehydrogenase [Prevotella sp.]|nr:iron-containing alcohol dehydrogenase [Staphylococcus sp.]MCM1349800.1 iron-containing alcohol dehydrogenase [Prevotella sp.]
MIPFTYYSPTKIIFGSGEETHIGEIIASYGYKKILFHYGKHSIFQTGLYQRVIASLQQAQIAYVELGGVEPNPKIDLVRKGVQLVKDEKIDFILAVGGGSVIDSGKSIACGACVDFDPWLFHTHKETPQQALPIGVILTISAAGSELSNSCVISHPEYHIKNGFNTDYVRPVFAIMNPELTYTVSPYQTACGIVDIMMHTLERYLVVESSLTFTDEVALALLKSVVQAGRKVQMNPQDYEARATLMIASSFSHNGLTGMGVKMYFTVHKLEHILSGMYDEVAHGAGLAILFPAWLKYISPYLIDKCYRLFVEVFGVCEENKEKTIVVGIEELKQFFKDMGMSTSWKEIGLTEPQLQELIDRATKSNTQTIPGFLPLDKQAIETIFNNAK